jgi:hypothetical protein
MIDTALLIAVANIMFVFSVLTRISLHPWNHKPNGTERGKSLDENHS